MSKKIIAIISVFTIVFVCLFAACDKSNYKNPATGVEYELVTDENGNKVLSKDGELLAYEKDENGKYVTEENGEKVTKVQGFIGQIEENGVVEDFAYKLKLPEGWKTTDKFGEFVNKSKEQTADVSILDVPYAEYYTRVAEVYKKSKDTEGVKASLEDDLTFLENADGTTRLTLETDGNVVIVVIFRNSGNLYKVLFNGKATDGVVADCEAFCKAIDFKPYKYYDETTTTTVATTEK